MRGSIALGAADHAARYGCARCLFAMRPTEQLPLGASVVIPACAVVGFMGANGSGKTTLLDLVSGLLEPQSGTSKWTECALIARTAVLAVNHCLRSTACIRI